MPMRHLTGLSSDAVATLLFALVLLVVGADLLSDAGSGAGGFHLGSEGLGTLVAAIGALVFLRRLLAERQESATWRAKAEDLLAQTGGSVRDQFVVWELTPAESEVALLLLKGLSLKEAAAVRSTSERTTREQARAVYKKAQVAGRAELAAWFIEDLLGDRGC